MAASRANSRNAASKLIHPTRLFAVGPSKAGKTTLIVDIIKNIIAPQVNRAIAFVPTFHRQKTFNPIRSLFKREDVYTRPNNKCLESVMNKIHHNLERCEAADIPTEKILILIDDMSGASIIQGRRMGPFAQLAVQSCHWDVTLVVIAHQPTNCDPNFRDNVENIILMADKGMGSYEWLTKSYTSLDMDRHLMKKVLLTAWRGGRADNAERGKHFLYIHAEPLGATRFFIDFDKEINVD